MRTTVSLDDDVALALKRLAHERDEPFKRVLNETLRAGLGAARRAAEPYRMKPSRLRLRRDIDFTKTMQLAAELEDENLVFKLREGR
jgi:predicted secreted hydrolase